MLKMDTATPVQILNEADSIAHCPSTHSKSINPIILPLAMGKQLGRLGSLALVRQPV